LGVPALIGTDRPALLHCFAVRENLTVYDVVGGMPFFDELTRHFYGAVATDPVLLTVYPTPQDLEPARRHLALFLAQYWGGPPDYQEERGHPQLRMRHHPFAIGELEHDRWLAHMEAALETMAPPAEVRRQMVEYFRMAAGALRNRE
jgi:hemoglobin